MELQIIGVLTAALLVGVELVDSTEEQHASIALSLSHHTNASGHAILNGKLEQPAEAAWHLDVDLRTSSCGAAARSQVLTFGLAGPPVRVPPGYALREGFGFFRAATHALSWTAARDACARDGAALAFAQSQEEALMLATQFNFDVSGTHVKNLAWYGASDHAEEGTYVTVTGLTLGKTGYASFSPGTPHGGTERNCIYIINSTGLLVDGFCKTPIAYICKVSL